jgi:hypothetical protein
MTEGKRPALAWRADPNGPRQEITALRCDGTVYVNDLECRLIHRGADGGETVLAMKVDGEMRAAVDGNVLGEEAP